MPELRSDPLQRRWVIIAAERSRRPSDFVVSGDLVDDREECPFCYGSEDKTPPELYALRPPGSNPDTPGWQIRVVPNMYPALTVSQNSVNQTTNTDLYSSIPGEGAHEVIIEGADHELSMAEFQPDLTESIFSVYRSRIQSLSLNEKLKYILIFKNHGKTAGASLSHPHSQIIATPVIPRTVAIELNSCREYYQTHTRCMICDMLKTESASGTRMIYNDGSIAAFTSYASRFPFEVFVTPIEHNHDYAMESDATVSKLAFCMQAVLGSMKSVLDNPPLNYILHTAPNVNSDYPNANYWKTLDRDFHWHIEIIPRLTTTAGFEWGSGLHINPMKPEIAAGHLREGIS